jgi:anti-anti-sigma regulatory factor
MAESPAVHEFVSHVMHEEPSDPLLKDQRLWIDLSECLYLDSTFLGSLLDLHRQFGRGPSPRLTLVAPDDIVQKLFAPTHLHVVFRFEHQVPHPVQDWVPLACHPKGSSELARHVMECHQQLAQVEGPSQRAFAAIAQQLQREMETQQS